MFYDAFQRQVCQLATSFVYFRSIFVDSFSDSRYFYVSLIKVFTVFSEMVYKSYFIDSAKIMGFKPELFTLEEPFIKKTSKKKRRQQKIGSVQNNFAWLVIIY